MSRQHQVVPSGRAILVVDDQAETLQSVAALLRREGHRVLLADSGSKALAVLRTERVDLILVDYFMPVMSGELLIRAIRERDPLVQIILQTGYAGEKPPREMLRRLAIQGYHDKSDGPDRLVLWVDVALKAADQLKRVAAAEQMKGHLLADHPHEFRRPLAAILGSVEVLRDGTVDRRGPEGARLLQAIEGSGDRLLELVGKSLGLESMQAGATPVCSERVRLSPLLAELQRWCSSVVGERPIEVAVDALPDVAAAGEPGKVRILLESLLANAIESSAAGQVRLAAEVLPDRRIAIHVRGAGPGIPSEEQESIFDLLQGAERGGDVLRGLGLPLARRLARLIGGDVLVESSADGGTTLTLLLEPANAESQTTDPTRARDRTAA